MSLRSSLTCDAMSQSRTQASSPPETRRTLSAQKRVACTALQPHPITAEWPGHKGTMRFNAEPCKNPPEEGR